MPKEDMMGDITVGSEHYHVENVHDEGGDLWLDVNQDGDVNDPEDHKLQLTKDELATVLGVNTGRAGAEVPLEELIDSISESGGDINDLIDALKMIKQEVRGLEQRLKNLQRSSAPADQIKAIEDAIKALKKEAQQVADQLTENPGDLSRGQKRQLKAILRNMDYVNADLDAEESRPSSRAASDGGGTGRSGSGKQANRGQNSPRHAGGPGMGGTPFGTTYVPGGGSRFNIDNYLNSIYMDQMALEGWDTVGKNQANQKKMMMLFFYFAKMAMSGDLGAMYRFMQFITYIISKDKALQNINMASKLIEMENSSRAALQELLDAPTPDGSDQSASYEFTKIMERTKAHQSSIATSQKLIAQMMEEMAQVVETLTGATKNALDANGRILQRLTRG